MNIYNQHYQSNDFTHSTHAQWKAYGQTSFINLLHHLGYPKTASLEMLKSYFDYIEFETNTYILKEGDPCDRFYYLINGSVKITQKKQDEDVTFALFNEGNLVSSIFDFFAGTPSQYSFETRSFTRCLSLTKENYDKVTSLMEKEGAQKVILNIHQLFMQYMMWLQGYQSLSSVNRIKDLYKKFPEIPQNFKEEDVASLLGLRRETYNRLKKEVLKEL